MEGDFLYQIEHEIIERRIHEADEHADDGDPTDSDNHPSPGDREREGW